MSTDPTSTARDWLARFATALDQAAQGPGQPETVMALFAPECF